MLNLLNVATSDTAFDGESVSVSLDATQNSAFSFNNLLSLGDKSQSNNVNVSIFDNFLNSDNISEIDLKHLSQIIDKNPIASLNMKLALIAKLDELKAKFIDDGLVDSIIDKLNNIKPIANNKNNSQNLSNELQERILFTPNNKIKEPFKPNANITINSIEDIEKISNEYDLNISKIKIETYENKNLETSKNTQLQTNIDTPKMLDTSDVILFKNIKNKSVNSSNDAIKDILTSFTNNTDDKSNTVKILPASSEVNPIKEVEKINRLAFFNKDNIEDFKNSQSLKDIQILNNSDFKNDLHMKKEKEYSLKDVFSSVSTAQTKETQRTTSFYNYEPVEIISEDNEKKITLKNMLDLKDKIITNEKHILDDTNKEKSKHIITSQETSNKLVQKPELMKAMLAITPNAKSSNLINAKIDDKANKTKLLNSLIDNSINRMAITNENQDNKRIKILIQELSQMNKEPLEDKKDENNKSLKIQIEPLVLNEEDLNIDNEQMTTKESTTSQKNSIIDVSKFTESNQSKELNQIMQRQIINGVYENLRYKLRNFVAPLMKFALELNPVHLGRIDVEVMVRGSSLQVSIKSSKKVSSLLEEEGAQLEKEFSVLGYKNIIMNFSGTDSGAKDNRVKEEENLIIKKDSK